MKHILQDAHSRKLVNKRFIAVCDCYWWSSPNGCKNVNLSAVDVCSRGYVILRYDFAFWLPEHTIDKWQNHVAAQRWRLDIITHSIQISNRKHLIRSQRMLFDSENSSATNPIQLRWNWPTKSTIEDNAVLRWSLTGAKAHVIMFLHFKYHKLIMCWA